MNLIPDVTKAGIDVVYVCVFFLQKTRRRTMRTRRDDASESHTCADLNLISARQQQEPSFCMGSTETRVSSEAPNDAKVRRAWLRLCHGYTHTHSGSLSAMLMSELLVMEAPYVQWWWCLMRWYCSRISTGAAGPWRAQGLMLWMLMWWRLAHHYQALFGAGCLARWVSMIFFVLLCRHMMRVRGLAVFV